MHKTRLEAFSDGVFAIIITIMVLELRVPHGDLPESLKPLLPVFFSYLLSFINVGIYWNNHHHMFHAVKSINGTTLWLNLHLLFWLSLVPFTTNWLGENHFSSWPVALYGLVLFMAGVAYYLLARHLVKIHGEESTLAKAFGKDKKGLTSVVLYGIAMPIAIIQPTISLILYAAVAIFWIIPDQRIEKNVASGE